MKRSYKIFSVFTGILLLSGCTKIDVPVEDVLTPDNFPTSDAQYIQAAGPAYVSFRGTYCTSYWMEQTLSTDEAILPSRPPRRKRFTFLRASRARPTGGVPYLKKGVLATGRGVHPIV